MIERLPFGKTGHVSSRIIFGAAALGAMKPARAEQTLELLDQYHINHIDTAASYGDSELRLAPFLATRRADFFLATKTGERTYDGAKTQLHRSLERLGVDGVDLIQLHNLAQPDQWQVALGEGGAVEAMVEAREQGLVGNIGVTGHGTYIAQRHLESLTAFDFASILLPYNYSMMQDPDYASDFHAVVAAADARGVAVQTIKSIARRRWRDNDQGKRFSWYMPISEPAALRRAVHYVMAQPTLFLNTTSDATLIEPIMRFASEPIEVPSDAQMAADQVDQGVEPLFVRDVSDDVMLAN